MWECSVTVARAQPFQDGLAYDGGTTALGAVRLGSTPSSPTNRKTPIKIEVSVFLLCYFLKFLARLWSIT